MSTFIQANEFFRTIDEREEQASYRLRALARIMTDVPNRGERLTASMQSALGLFTIINPDDHRPGRNVATSHTDRRNTARENAYERSSQAEAERLRILPKRKLKASCYSHVRELRPVPADLVRWAKALGIGLA